MNSEELPNLDRIGEVKISVSASLAGARRTLREALSLQPGAVLALEAPAEAPVELYANGRAIGRGEIVLSGKNLAVQVTELT